MNQPDHKRVHVICSKEATDGIDKMLRELGYKPTYEIPAHPTISWEVARAHFEATLHAWEEAATLIIDLDFAKSFEFGVALGYMMARGRTLIGYKSMGADGTDFRALEAMFIVKDMEQLRKVMDTLHDANERRKP
jgi:hypothetical protein